MGIRELFHACGYKTFELDGADGETPDDIITWIKRVRRVKVLNGKTAVLVDDFESFTPNLRSKMARLLESMASNTHLAPIVITCTQLKDPSMKELQTLDNIRLFRPREYDIKEWFQHHHKWKLTEANGNTIVRKGFPREWVEAESHLILSGDIRRVRIALEFHIRTGHALESNNHTDSTTNLNSFESARRLLLCKTSASTWAHNAEPRDVVLLQHHLPRYVDNDIDRLADAFDRLSEADVCQPSHFEQRDLHASYPLHQVAHTIRLSSRAQDVGALVPPRRLPIKSDRERTTRDGDPRGWHLQSEWSEVPSLLGGLKLQTPD